MNPLILLMTALCFHTVEANTVDTTRLLIQDLFQNYSKDIRPIQDQTKPVIVNINLDLISLNDFDEVEGTISMVVVAYISWNDRNLVWNPTMYGNVSYLTFKQDKIWIPDMFLCNPADSLTPIGNEHTKVTVLFNGFVTWQPGALLEATCTPNVYSYPFDQQTCQLSLSSWGYSSQQVKIAISSPTFYFNFFQQNIEWKIISSRTKVWSGTFDTGYFDLTIERRHLNFLVTVVIPIIMLAFVNPFVFLLPFNSGERISYSITVLLAFTVYMTVVSDRMPASSLPISYISYFLLSLVGISVAIVTMNIFQIRTYSKHDNDEPVPKWVRKSYLFTRNLFRYRKVNTDDQMKKSFGTEYDGIDIKGTQLLDLDSQKENGDVFYTTVLPLAQVTEKSSSENIPIIPDNHQEVVTWHMMAKITDKMCFFLFSILTIATTMSYFISAGAH
ncbi:acetylcholine receptor subunit alpha-like [Argopecten irradians]|uniref:acetylcholine receptor subunit alpha-like n=1 Tax=Argopecten irradians TaxID=31199 RepID=UPI003714C766